MTQHLREAFSVMSFIDLFFNYHITNPSNALEIIAFFANIIYFSFNFPEPKKIVFLFAFVVVISKWHSRVADQLNDNGLIFV